MIVDFFELKKIKEHKEKVVLGFLVSYYKDMNDSSGLNIPYFIEAQKTYNELIHSYKDLNKYYKKIVGR